MDRIIRVQTRSVYGRVYHYPMNDTAQMISKLTYRSTLSDEDLKSLRILGYEIEQVPIALFED